MLSNIFKRGSVPQGTQNAPLGANPNKGTEATPWKNFVESTQATIRDNLSITNTVNQGMYRSFGNNPFTRIASGMMSNIGSSFSEMIGKQEESPEAKGLRAIKESIDAQKDDIHQQLIVLNEILKETKASKQKVQSEPIDVEDLNQNKNKRKWTRRKKKQVDADDMESSSREVIPVGPVTMTPGYGPKKKRPKTKKILEQYTTTSFDDLKQTVQEQKTYPVAVVSQKESPLTCLQKISKNVDILVKYIGKIFSQQEKERLSSAENERESNRKLLSYNSSGVQDVKYKDVPNQIQQDKTSIFDDIIKWFTVAMAPFLGKAIDFVKVGLESLKESTMKIVKNSIDFLHESFSSMKKFFSETVPEAFTKAKGFVDDVVKAVKESPIVTKIGEALKSVGASVSEYGGKALSAFGKIAEKAAVPLFTAYDSFTGAKDAENILDIKGGREATFAERMSASYGNVASSLSFGLLDNKKTSRWLSDNVFGGESETTKLIRQNEEMQRFRESIKQGSSSPTIVAPVTNNSTNTSIFPGANSTNNSDASLNRYFDRHYSF